MRLFIMLLSLVLGIVANANPECHQANKHETYVFAVNWQPGFCKNRTKHPECDELRKSPAALNNFSLHGLWPNKDGCGKDYGFCDNRVPTGLAMCSFPAVALSDRLIQILREFMPSVKFQSCLERHEWWKHGTCSNMSADEYFQLSFMMLDEFNASNFVNFIRENIGREVAREKMLSKLDESFGKNARKHITLRCRSGSLEEVRIQLPREINNSALRTLILRSREANELGTCPEKVSILSGRKVFF